MVRYQIAIILVSTWDISGWFQRLISVYAVVFYYINRKRFRTFLSTALVLYANSHGVFYAIFALKKSEITYFTVLFDLKIYFFIYWWYENVIFFLIISFHSIQVISNVYDRKSIVHHYFLDNFLIFDILIRKKISDEIMRDKALSVIYTGNYLNEMKNNNKKEYDVFISSVYKEINFEIK